MFRLAGTRLCATYGRELKGLPFRLLFPNNDRLVARLVSRVMEGRSVVVIGSEAISRDGRSIAFEALLLPLDAGEGRRSFGVFSAREAPFWLGADPVTQTRFKSVRIIEPDLEPVFENRPSIVTSSSASLKAFAFSQPPLNARRVGHLVVLTGGKRE